MTLTPTKITLGIVTLVFAAGMSWQGIVSRANELEARDQQIQEKHEKDQAEFQATVTKIGEWIETANEKQIRNDENLKALCAAKKLTAGAAYCQTRGYPWGID
jgi:hypothetical protein